MLYQEIKETLKTLSAEGFKKQMADGAVIIGFKIMWMISVSDLSFSMILFGQDFHFSLAHSFLEMLDGI